MARGDEAADLVLKGRRLLSVGALIEGPTHVGQIHNGPNGTWDSALDCASVRAQMDVRRLASGLSMWLSRRVPAAWQLEHVPRGAQRRMRVTPHCPSDARFGLFHQD